MATPLYHPLQQDQREVRFICISPVQNDVDIISCALHTRLLDQDQLYYALSYVWGPPTHTTVILLNGKTITVTVNLAAALQQLRASGYTDVPIWIDALSIDQKNDIEKTVQIGLMGDIYGNAKLVIGWLGPCSETSDLAVNTIQSWGEQSRVLLSQEDNDVGDILTQLAGNESFLSAEIAEAIVQLFERKWWYRQWISQEIILANDILILCGDKTFGWPDLYYANQAWRTLMRPIYAEYFTAPQQLWFGALASDVFELFEGLRDTRRSNEPTPLDHLLPTFRGFPVTDARDKIYALLGFASDGAPVTPDYQTTTKELYTRYMISRLQSTDDIDILQHCFFHEKSTQQGIPSWVPDWSNSDVPPSIKYQAYKCAGTYESRITISPESAVLQIEGIRIAKITRSFPAKALLPPLTPEEEAQSSVWKSFIPSHNDPRQMFKETWGVRLFRTTYMDIDPITSQRLDQNSTSFFGLLFANCWWLRHYHRVPDNVILKTWFGQQDTLKNRDDLNMMTKKWLPEYEPHILQGFQTEGRCFFVTEDEDIGLCPSSIGDGNGEEYLVCVLLGARVPFVLRKLEHGFAIVGECFMLGSMDGEVVMRLKNGELVLETFEIH